MFMLRSTDWKNLNYSLRVASVNMEGNCRTELSAQNGHMSHLEIYKVVKQSSQINAIIGP